MCQYYCVYIGGSGGFFEVDMTYKRFEKKEA